MRGLEGELERRTLTYTSWNQSAMREKGRSWHPITFDYADATPHKIKEIKVNSRAKFGPIFRHFLSLSHNALEEKCSIQKV